MTNSSPLRRSQLLSSPERPLSSFLLDGRNTELSHRDALAAAQAEHDRVREAAIRVYELHELKEEHNRILEQERREQERLKAEAAIAAEEKRLQELRAKSIPKPPPPKPEPERPMVAEQPPAAEKSEPIKKPEATPAQTELKTQPPLTSPQQNGFLSNLGKPAQANPFATAAPQKTQVSAPAAPKSSSISSPPVNLTPLQQPAAQNQTKPQQPQPTQVTPQQPPSQVTKQTSDRYAQIHQALKQLRKDLVASTKVAGSPLKGKVGTVRREIRVSIGQLTGGKGANVQPV